VEVVSQGGRFDLLLHQHGLLRPLASSELSDGTLRFLLWTAALLTPRPPALLVLNEPETSLHPDLLTPLAELVATASVHTQVIVVTHSAALVQALRGDTAGAARDVHVVELTKDFGQTTVVGQDRFHEPSWTWPAR
jgi:predicted ATPase